MQQREWNGVYILHGLYMSLYFSKAINLLLKKYSTGFFFFFKKYRYHIHVNAI